MAQVSAQRSREPPDPLFAGPVERNAVFTSRDLCIFHACPRYGLDLVDSGGTCTHRDAPCPDDAKSTCAGKLSKLIPSERLAPDQITVKADLSGCTGVISAHLRYKGRIVTKDESNGALSKAVGVGAGARRTNDG